MKNHHLHKIWNQVPVTYYQNGTKNNFFQKIWHTKKINLATDLIKNLKFNTCLDIGCASGYMLNEIYKTYPNAKYFGVDIYKKAIDYAKKQYPKITFKVSLAEKLPFKDSSMDLVLFYETIEHVEHPTEALKEIRRVLKKDGTLILTMDSGSLLFRIVWFLWESTKGNVWKGAHLHPFNHNELESLIKSAKFKTSEKIFSHWGMEVTFVLKKS